MRICPNKRSKSWKDLVRRVGNESIAYNIFFLRDGDIEDITDEEIASYVTPQDIEEHYGNQDVSFKPIKPGVDELFSSNPELASQVYEALGFGSKLRVSLGKELEYKDPYAKNRIKYFKKYEVLDENSKSIGTVVIEDRGNNTVILHPELSVIGKGYGKELYKAVSNKLNVTIQEWNEGGISKSDSAKKMWDSLEKEGTAKRIFDEESGDNFRELKYQSQITPEQEQEAKQRYSQYLDTIFPNSSVKDIVYHGTTEKFDKFDFTTLRKFGNITDINSGMFFSRDIDEAAGYGDGTYKNTIKAILNIKSIKDIGDLIGSRAKEYKGKYDAVEGFEPDTNARNIVVFEPEQIHILGNKQDIDGFKEFVSTPQKTPTISYKPKPTNTISIVKQAEFRDSLKAGNKVTFTYWSETTSKLVTEKDITITKVDFDRFEGVYEDGEERTFKYNNVIDETISGNLNHKEQQIFKDNLKIGKVFENLKTDLGLISGEVTEIGTDSFKIGDTEIKYAEVYKEESQIRLLDRIQTLKNSLSNQIIIFQSTMRTAAHKRRVDSLRRSLEILENYDELVDLEEFFSEVSKNILTSKAYLISIAQKDLPTEKKLALISYTKQFLDSFRYVEGLNNAIQNFEGCEKLKAVSKQLVADISDAKQEYFVVAQPAMAKILYEQFNPRTNEELLSLGLDPITEEDVLAELNQPSKDLDLFNKFGVAPINSNDTLLGLFQKMIKNVKESARKMDEYFLRSLNPVIAKLQKKYDIKKVMENFFTIEEVEVFRNGEPQIIRVRKFIKQYNVDEFNTDMSFFYQERDSAYMDLAVAEEEGDAVARDIARGKILKVNEQIDAYKQANGKIIDAKTSKYLTERYIAKDPIKFNNLLDRYYTPVEFEQTNQDSITYTDEDTGAVTYYNYRNNRWGANRDKYTTTKYAELQKYLDSDPDIKAFYDIIIENYKKANRSIPTSYRLNGILPSMYEKNFIKDTKKYVGNFLEENIPQYMARIDGKAHKEIPVGFTKLIDVSESSDDTLKSLMMFFAEANNYSTMNNFLGATENMVELLSVTNPLDENQKQRVTSDVNNRLSAVIKTIDQSVYNKQRDSNGPLSKLVDLLNQFTSLTRMALKPLNWAVNILRGNMENLFEGIGGRHYTVKDIVWANKEFIKLQSSNPRKLANMIRSLDAIQGRFLKEYGDEFVSFKEKYLKTDILFLGQDLGEIQIQGTSMLAMLRAWGVEIPADGNFDLDALPTDFINTLHAVNKRNHGVYNNFDRLYAQDNALFRLFMQFRKYIVPTYRARFSGIFSGKYRIDQEAGTTERGYYREFGEYVYKCMKNLNELPAMLASFKSMPAVQKEGVRRTMADLIAFFTLYTLVNLVKGDDEDEKDEMSPVEWYTVYFAARLRGEIGAYLPVFGTKDQLRIISNPFAAAPVIGDMFNLFATVTDLEPDKDGNISIFKEYQRKTGIHEKGDLKILGKFSKLNPLDNVLDTFYPEEMYDNFEAASKK